MKHKRTPVPIKFEFPVGLWLTKCFSALFTVVIEWGLAWLLYNHFIADQLHLPHGTWTQVLAVILLRNLAWMPFITAVDKH
jgi:hypothetical protein